MVGSWPRAAAAVDTGKPFWAMRLAAVSEHIGRGTGWEPGPLDGRLPDAVPPVGELHHQVSERWPRNHRFNPHRIASSIESPCHLQVAGRHLLLEVA
jgi:hypothetical protein